MAAFLEDVLAEDLLAAFMAGTEHRFREERDTAAEDERHAVDAHFLAKHLHEVVDRRIRIVFRTRQRLFIFGLGGEVIRKDLASTEIDGALLADDADFVKEAAVGDFAAGIVGQDDDTARDAVRQFHVEGAVGLDLQLLAAIVVVDVAFSGDRQFVKHPQNDILIVGSGVVDLAAAAEFGDAAPRRAVPVLRHVDVEFLHFADAALFDKVAGFHELALEMALVVDDADLLLRVAQLRDFDGVLGAADHRLLAEDVQAFLQGVFHMVVMRDMRREDADGVQIVLIDELLVVLWARVTFEVVVAENFGKIVQAIRIDIDGGDDLDAERMFRQFLKADGAHATAADGAETNGFGF